MGYKHDKEAFVSGAHGGSVARINTLALVAVTSYALWTVVHTRYLARLESADSAVVLVVEFAILVLPLLLALTVLSAHPLRVNAVLVLASVVCARYPARASLPSVSPQASAASPSPPPPPPHPQSPPSPFSRPFVTSYRAALMLMTVICILAVDFPVFPREWAKAETWGTSLMDLGVGSFVFSQGLVAARPVLRRLAPCTPGGGGGGRGPGQGPPGAVAALLHSLRRTAPLVLLGLVRVAMVKGVDYPEHVTEYGVHWNFFFTLAVLPVLGEAVTRGTLARGWDLHVAGLVTALAHELVLRQTGLQRWVLEAPRTDLLSQNKEGLASLPGYLAIYLLGLATGLYVLPASPALFRLHKTAVEKRHAPASSPRAREELRPQRGRQEGGDSDGDGPPGSECVACDPDPRPPQAEEGRRARWLGTAAVGYWALWALLSCWPADSTAPGAVSRRLANAAYVVWTAAFNCSFLVLYLGVHHLAGPTTSSPSVSGQPQQQQLPPPQLFEALNRNGLAVFLLANLLTGLVNVSLATLYTPDGIALLVLSGYSLAVCGAAWGLRRSRIRLG